MKLIFISTLFIVIFFSGCIGLYEMIIDTRKVSCDKLPNAKEVERILAEHTDTVEEIKNINPDHVWLEIDSERCPGKADIMIYYATIKNRASIKKLIGDTFFGIPYRMFNV